MIALAMVVRDEQDVIEENLRFHLEAGVDLVLVTDHRSRDGTREILERSAQERHVRLFREEGELVRQGAWMTRMARLAAVEHGADWVLCGDADEFWMPRGASLVEALEAAPGRYGAVHVLSQSFLPLPDDGGPWVERMTVRLAPPAPIQDPAGAYKPVSKIACRASPHVTVGDGNHSARGAPGAVLRAWYPLEILHFPLRTREQSERKYRKTWTGWEHNPRGDLARARAVQESGSDGGVYERVALSGRVLELGLANGSLVRDTRLRDALLDGPGRGMNAGHPLDVAVWAEAEIVRRQREVDELSLRLDRLAAR